MPMISNVMSLASSGKMLSNCIIHQEGSVHFFMQDLLKLTKQSMDNYDFRISLLSYCYTFNLVQIFTIIFFHPHRFRCSTFDSANQKSLCGADTDSVTDHSSHQRPSSRSNTDTDTCQPPRTRCRSTYCKCNHIIL